MDYMGNLCGVDAQVKDLKYKWEPNYNGITMSSTGDFVPTALGICVDSCTSALSLTQTVYHLSNLIRPFV
jgi:hypothetical protein